MGSACAYFVVSNPDFAGRVVVIEPDPSYANCATSRSWGGIRQQFTTPENIKMSQFGAEFVRHVGHYLAIEDEAPDLGFQENGYLFLVSHAQEALARAGQELQLSLGAKVKFLDREALALSFAWLNLEGVLGATLEAENSGWIDPQTLLRAFRRKAQSLGVEYLQDRVVSMEIVGGAVVSVTGAESGRLSGAKIVNAAGPQAGRVAALAGVGLPVVPKKRSSFVFDCRHGPSKTPLTIDVSGLAFRREGGQYIAILPPDPDPDVDPEDLEPDYALFDERIWPILAERVPAFEAIKLTGAWAGHYDYNTLDHNAIIGPHPDVENLFFCNGFSGHGLQQSPAAGRAVSELLLYGEYRSLDLSRLSFDRIAKGQPIKEGSVV